MAKRRKKPPQRKENGHVFRIVIFLLTLFLLFIVFQQRDYINRFNRLGYLGVLIINFISSATILLPLPGVASVFIGGAIWNPVLVGSFSAVGAMLGEIFGYFLGYGSRGFLRSFERKNNWIKNLEDFFRRTGFLTIFIFSLLPLPVFDLIGIMAGALNYSLLKFSLATLLGKLARNILIAFSGARILPY